MQGLMDLLSKRDDDSAAPSGDNRQVERSLSDDTAQAGFEAAAQDVYHALKRGDEDSFRDALQAAIEMSK